MRRSQKTATLPALALLGALLISVAPASAHFDTGMYTHHGCPAGNNDRIDPINIVFYGWGTWDRAVSQIQSHAAWTHSSGSTQTFVDHGNCYTMHAQRASGSGVSTRFHVRLHPIHRDPTYGWTTVGGAHHEDWVNFPPCGHAVDSNGPNGSGFDWGRRQLRIMFQAGGHQWEAYWWGNTQNFRQCDGDWARSDGITVWINMHQVNH